MVTVLALPVLCIRGWGREVNGEVNLASVANITKNANDLIQF